MIAGLCVAAVFAWLYIPYFHKPKQITQPVVVQAPVPAKPVQVAVNVPPTSEAQKTAKETPAKKGESAIVPAPKNLLPLSDAERQTRTCRCENQDCSGSKNCHFSSG